MIPSIETRIAEAIRARVASLPMAGQYQIVWTDGPLPAGQQSYTPSPTQRYLRCTWTPNRPSREGRVASDLPALRMGVLQVDVMGLKTQGSGVAREVAGQVAAHFPLDFCMPFMGASVRVMEPPAVGPVFIDTHVQVPVSIEVQTYG